MPFEKYFDYILRLSTPNPDDTLYSQALELQGDAGFSLRGVFQCYGDPPIGDNQARFGFRMRGPAGGYLQRAMYPSALMPFNAGNDRSPMPVYPPLEYPPSGQVLGDYLSEPVNPNQYTSFLFKGVKTFDAEPLQYHGPQKYLRKFFVHTLNSQDFIVVPMNQGGLSGSEAPQHLQLTIQMDGDADFALYAIHSPAVAVTDPQLNFGILTPAMGSGQVLLRWYDSYQAQMSNDWLPLEGLCGNPQYPMPIYPELVFPANGAFTFDWWRHFDHNAAEGPDLAFTLVLIGEKRFPLD